MTICFSEMCLYITMRSGNKVYAPRVTATHELEVFTIQDRREANAEVQATGQSSAPIRTLMGRKLDTFVIEFPIPNMTASLTALPSDARVRNTPKNLFLASSILTVTDNTYTTELPVGSNWFVESFSLKRTSARRMYVGTLTLKRWYGDLPVAG